MIEARISVQLDPLSEKLGIAIEKLRVGLVSAIADWLRLVIRKSFEQESTAEGAKWAALSPAYAARKKGPGILRETSAMFEQVDRGMTVDGNTITAGSTLPYAAVHQFGFDGEVSVRQSLRRVRSRDVFGKMLGKNNKIVHGRIAMGLGQAAAHSRRMRIPARPYLPSPEFIETEGAKIAEEFAKDVLGGG